MDRVDNTGVGKVIRSEDPNFKPGDYVVGFFGGYFIYLNRTVPIIRYFR